jgi:hypothetical protein
MPAFMRVPRLILAGQWPSRLVATAAEDCLKHLAQSASAIAEQSAFNKYTP